MVPIGGMSSLLNSEEFVGLLTDKFADRRDFKFVF
jgi:hypothetical protein